MWPHQPIVFN